MKKCISVIFMFILAFTAPIVVSGCKAKDVSLSTYSLDVTYNEKTHILDGNMVVNYYNFSDNAFSSLLFHLYPNAFREEAKSKPVSATSEDRAYPNGPSYGNITINGVFSEGKELGFEIGGEDLNILSVTLPQELYPDERVKVNIIFEVQLANINHRLGYGANAVNFGNFYPIVCVYENGKGWQTDLYCSNGDPFYSEVANYKVRITYSKDFTLASSGVQVNTVEQEGKKVTQIEGEKIRDFAFVLCDKFEKLSAKAGNVTINYYYYSDPQPLLNLQVSSDAVETFSDKFGQYPYSQISIVETGFVHGGMEYPNLVMISDQSGGEFDYVIVHEIAHQWWYGVVGSNQVRHAWMDEGLTDYSAMLFFREKKEYNRNFDEMIDSATESYKLFVKLYSNLTGSVDTSMERALSEFDTEPEYTQCTYVKGALMFDTLRETVGDKKFFKALRDYFKNYALKNAEPADMIVSFENSTGYDLEGFFDSWLSGKVVVL